MIKKILKHIKNGTLKKTLLLKYYRKKLFKKDKPNIKVINKYGFLKLGYKMDIEHPKTFNEKLQWLKLHDKKDIYTTMVDKYESKKYFETLIDSKYIIPTLGIYNNFDEIDFDKLPNKFVIKTTHDSGGVVICNDKASFDLHKAKETISARLKLDYYKTCFEWPYKNVKRRIIVEEMLEPKNKKGLIEYKIFCFDGVAKLVLICKGKAHGNGRTNDFYDIDFNHIPVSVTFPNSKDLETKPKQFDEMIAIASKISQGISQLRVDFYLCDDKVYIGETTFYHDSGFCPFNPISYDSEFGKLINLENRKD